MSERAYQHTVTVNPYCHQTLQNRCCLSYAVEPSVQCWVVVCLLCFKTIPLPLPGLAWLLRPDQTSRIQHLASSTQHCTAVLWFQQITLASLQSATPRPRDPIESTFIA